MNVKHFACLRVYMQRFLQVTAVFFVFGTPVFSSPTCNLPDDIIAWMQDRSILEIVEAWPRIAHEGPLWLAFLALLRGTANEEQLALVASCTG